MILNFINKIFAKIRMSSQYSLEAQITLLKSQAAISNYYFAGSRVLVNRDQILVSGGTYYSSKDNLHHMAASLIYPARTCIDVGPGLRPQRLLSCDGHILLEPWEPYAKLLTSSYPEKLVIQEYALEFLNKCLDKSIDTIFLLDVIEHMHKDVGLSVVRESMRIARLQVVIFTPLGFMEQHYDDIGQEWGDIKHGDVQNHLSGWMPEEFPDSTTVVCKNYHGRSGENFGAFYSIINLNKEVGRLILVSADPPAEFSFSATDIIIADPKYSELSFYINNVPKRNMIIVPLLLLAENLNMPIEILRRSILNFDKLIYYTRCYPSPNAIGAASHHVLEKCLNVWSA